MDTLARNAGTSGPSRWTGRFPAQVRRNAEEWPPHILYPDIAEVLLEQPGNFLTLGEGKEGQRVVVDRIGLHECAAQPLPDLGIIPFERDAGTDDCSHAATADHVDRNMRLAQCAHDPEMSKSARPAGAQDEADCLACQNPRKAGEIIAVAEADVANKIDWQPLAPVPSGLAGARGAILVPFLHMVGQPSRGYER
jgi:hypothetical protein